MLLCSERRDPMRLEVAWRRLRFSPLSLSCKPKAKRTNNTRTKPLLTPKTDKAVQIGLKGSIIDAQYSRRAPAANIVDENARRAYTNSGNGRLIWCLSSSQSLSAGFSNEHEAMDISQSAPQRAHYVICGRYFLVPLTGN